MRPSQLCLSPCPPTSAPQKQYPAFSTQMEVTPYASKPLSSCQGSRGLAEVTVEESLSFCLHLPLLFLLFSFFRSPPVFLIWTLPTAFIFYIIFLPTSFVLSAPLLRCSLCSPSLWPSLLCHCASAQGALAAPPFEYWCTSPNKFFFPLQGLPQGLVHSVCVSILTNIRFIFAQPDRSNVAEHI